MVTVDERVGNDKVEDTQGGNELSKLFLVCPVKQCKEKNKRMKQKQSLQMANKQIIDLYVATEENLEANMH